MAFNGAGVRDTTITIARLWRELRLCDNGTFFQVHSPVIIPYMYILDPQNSSSRLMMAGASYSLNTVTPFLNGLNWSSSACSPMVPLPWGYVGTAAHLPIAHMPNTFATAVKGKAVAPAG